jgi:hypothetical protein
MGRQVGSIYERAIETENEEGREKERYISVVMTLEVEVAQHGVVNETGGVPSRLIHRWVE